MKAWRRMFRSGRCEWSAEDGGTETGYGICLPDFDEDIITEACYIEHSLPIPLKLEKWDTRPESYKVSLELDMISTCRATYCTSSMSNVSRSASFEKGRRTSVSLPDEASPLVWTILHRMS